MKRFITLAVMAGLLTLSALTAFGDDLAKLEGKWSVKKTNDDGQTYTQVVEIKKDKFKFRIIGTGDQVVLYAEGTVKTETMGSFNVAKFTDIKAGGSEGDAQPINDDRSSVYMLGYNTWTLASNFDKDRDNQKPSVDVYSKATK